MNIKDEYKRTAGEAHHKDFERTDQPEPLQPAPIAQVLIAAVGFVAGASLVLYIAYMVLIAIGG